MGVGLPRHQPSERERLAEHRRRLGQGQRRRGVEEPPVAGEVAVQAVAQLVRQRQDGPPLPREAHQHVGMDTGHRGGAEGPVLLVRADGGVDPAGLEELLDDIAGHRGERPVRVEHERPCVLPGQRACGAPDRRRAVVVLQPVEAEQRCLQPVVALRDVVAGSDRVDQRLHRLVGGLVGEIARAEPVRVAAEPVLDGLVVQQRVQDERPRAQPGGERLGDPLRRLPSNLAVGLLKPALRQLERHLLVSL